MEGRGETMRQGIMRYSLPLGVYTDKHTIFRSINEKLTIDEELDGINVPLSNFGKAMAELGIEHIKADTPQAKGRTERLWKTLRDRLPVELRLLVANNIEYANAALSTLIDDYNIHFSVRAAENENVRQPPNKNVSLDYVFTKRGTRVVGSGSEISYKNNLYVPCAGEPNPETRTTVGVREIFSGGVVMWYKGQAVKPRKIENAGRSAPKSEGTVMPKPAALRIPREPAPDHPWRKPWKRTQRADKVAAVAV